MTTLSGFRFEPIDPLMRHSHHYKQLHNILFANTAISYEWIDWYHGAIGRLNSGFSETRTYGVFDRDLLVGIWSVEPKEFNNDLGRVIHVGRCFSVGIHPEYRRHGLFVALSKYAIDQERKAAQYEYILGFPQIGRPVVAGHLKAGWEIVQNIEMHSINPENMEVFTPRSRVQWISDFGISPLLADIRGSFSRESTAYRNLRWLHHPDNQYICLTYEQGYIVLKPYGGLCHILDLQGESQSISILLEVSKTLARRHHWHEVNIWCADNEIYRQEIMNAGFKVGSQLAQSVVLIAVRINATTPLSLTTGSHLQMGLEEIY